MIRKLALFMVPSIAIVGALVAMAGPPQDIPTFKTVWDGVYTDAQAARGKEIFDVHCTECHGDNLGGTVAPPLVGDRFMEYWREGALDNIYDFMRASMPAERPKEDLTDQSYLDILAYILKSNDFPAAQQELAREPLWTIELVGKDGPMPLPNQTPIMTVGCLTQAADKSWTLTNAAEPSRNKKLDETFPMELKVFEARPLGTLTFRLPNAFGYNPDAHKGQKVLAKGVYGKQTAGDRINLTLLETVASSCGN